MPQIANLQIIMNRCVDRMINGCETWVGELRVPPPHWPLGNLLQGVVELSTKSVRVIGVKIQTNRSADKCDCIWGEFLVELIREL